MPYDYNRLAAALTGAGIRYSFDEPMAPRCSFRAGGRAAIFIEPADREQFIESCRLVSEAGLPRFILGRGTNILVGDGGYDGAVIASYPALGGIDVSGAVMTCGAGVTNASAASAASSASLAGFEFAAGIPGTVGGGLRMNAGAYGGEYADIVTECEYLDGGGEIKTLSNDGCTFGYRSSFFLAHPECAALSASFALRHGERAEIERLMSELAAKRKKSQPLEYPSAGSTFRRPEGYFAGALIESAGLKGRRVGGAMVSEKHAGFVINAGGATARDVAQLTELVQSEVMRVHGVALEREVIFLGNF